MRVNRELEIEAQREYNKRQSQRNKMLQNYTCDGQISVEDWLNSLGESEEQVIEYEENEFLPF